jgi:PAS domain S-box-containing protein
MSSTIPSPPGLVPAPEPAPLHPCSEDGYRTIFEVAGDALCVMDPATGRIVDANHALCQRHGYTLDEVRRIGVAGLSAGVDGSTDENAQAFVRRAAGGEQLTCEWLSRTRDGEVVVWEVYTTRATLSGEERVISVAREIGERKRAEAVLRDSEESYRTIFQSVADAIYVLDVETGAILDANPAACELNGRTLEEMRTLGIGGMSSTESGFTWELAGELIRRAAEGDPQQVEWMGMHSSGNPVWGEVTLRRVAILGQPRVLATVRDITDRKEAEEALRRANEELERRVEARTAELAVANRALETEISEHRAARERLVERTREMEGIFQAMPDLYFRMDMEGRILDYRTARDGNLYAPPSAFMGARMQDVVPPELGRRFTDALAEIHRTGEMVAMEYTLEIGGTPRDYEARLLPLADGSVIDLVRDITARKDAERALRASEEHFRAVIENSSDVATIVSAEGRVEYISPAVTRVLGHDPAEMIGESAIARVHPDDVPTVAAAVEELARTPAAHVSVRYRFRHRDGSWRVLESMSRKMWPDAAAPMVVNSRDITERERAERALQERETRFRRMIENASDMIQIVGPDTRVVYTGPSVLPLLGYTPEEIAGTSAFDYLHPDDVQATLARFAEMLAQPGVPVLAEYRVRHRNGGWRDFEAVAMTFSSASTEEGVVVNARDITERKRAAEALRRSEERFRAMIENAHDSIVILDGEGTMRYQSPSVQRVLGYTPEELIGRSAFDYVHPDDAPRVAQMLAAVIRHPGTTGAVDYRFRHRDGGWRLFEAFGRTLLPDSPEEGVVTNVRDVTERRRSEDALRQAKADAERANQAKSEFLSRMSHELRTPLNSILGFGQILAEVELGAADRKAVHHILTAGEHLLNLIDEVLDISRIEAGRAHLSLEPVRLDAVVREAVGMVRPIADARGVWVSVDVADAGVFVHADRQRLAQVLLNLLSNAVKYNRPAGQVRIACEAMRGEDGAGRVRLRVEDTGHGIPAGERDQLFVPFARLGAERSGIEGTGLGLSLSRRLVEAMGGRLELEGSTPAGSTFAVELRRTVDPADAAATQARALVPEAAEPHTEATLLYVEDNLANLSLIEMLLERRAGWRLIPALQGGLGVELARQHAPDVVLLDLHLPDIPGEEVLRQLRADPRTAAIPVIVISADATPKSIERLRAAGADDYLSKPLDVKRFVQAVGRMLARREEG